jgi:hypothetical protein
VAEISAESVKHSSTAPGFRHKICVSSWLEGPHGILLCQIEAKDLRQIAPQATIYGRSSLLTCAWLRITCKPCAEAATTVKGKKRPPVAQALKWRPMSDVTIHLSYGQLSFALAASGAIAGTVAKWFADRVAKGSDALLATRAKNLASHQDLEMLIAVALLIIWRRYLQAIWRKVGRAGMGRVVVGGSRSWTVTLPPARTPLRE